MKNFLKNLNDRDRVALFIGASCLLMYFLYLMVYSPIVTALDQKAFHLSEKQKTLSWMQAVQRKKISKNEPLSVNNAQLLSVLNRKLKEAQFEPFAYQLQQDSSGNIQLSFDEIPLVPFLSWLFRMNGSYAFTLQRFVANRVETSGMAKVSIILMAR